MLMLIVIAGAAICLTVGIAFGKTALLWCALAISLVGVAATVPLVLRRRSATTAAVTSVLDSTPVPAASVVEVAQAADESGGSNGHTGTTADEAAPESAPTSAGAQVCEQMSGQMSMVVVVPGRQRFHLPECRLLAGKPMEEIGLEEATEEGFSACTVCIPQRDLLGRTPDPVSGHPAETML